MRIDKYLKVARIIKRREVAKSLALENRILLNGNYAKAHSEVKIGDKVSVIFGNRTISFEIKDIKEQVSKQEALSLYIIIEDKTADEV